MKKALIIYAAVLAGVFVLLSVLGQKGDYPVEKKVWKLYQEQLDIAKDPRVIPERAFERVIKGYRKILKRYPDSRLTPVLYIRLGEVYSMKADYGSAREVLKEAISRYPDNKELAAEALFKIGKTYEVQKNWIEASKRYNAVIREYPGTETAITVPIYIANYYKARNDFQKTMEAYQVAIRYYQKTVAEHEGTKLGLTALRYLSNCYLDQNRWNEAINTLGTVIEKYAESGYLSVGDINKSIKTINVVSSYELKDYDAAIRLYQGIIDRNPGRRMNGYLRKVIDAFRQLKEKGVEPSSLK